MNPTNITLTAEDVVPVPVTLIEAGRSYQLGLAVSGPFLYVDQDGIFRGKLSLSEAPVYELRVAVMGGSLIVQQGTGLRGTLSLQDAPVPPAALVLSEG